MLKLVRTRGRASRQTAGRRVAAVGIFRGKVGGGKKTDLGTTGRAVTDNTRKGFSCPFLPDGSCHQ